MCDGLLSMWIHTKGRSALLWNFFKKRPLARHWNRKVPMTEVKQRIIEKKFPSPIQFVLSSKAFWMGQKAYHSHYDPSQIEANHPVEIKWHWDTTSDTSSTL